MVFVACCAALTAASPEAMMTSTWPLTSSAACSAYVSIESGRGARSAGVLGGDQLRPVG